ncbi:unnamed protein product [Tenebrio molitor]|nr:unnamed protein product [Tenebrio molitor]
MEGKRKVLVISYIFSVLFLCCVYSVLYFQCELFSIPTTENAG